MTVWTIGHGTRPAEELVQMLRAAGVCTLWWRCHRRLIAELLHARGEEVVHLLSPGKQQLHRPLLEADARDRHLYLCGAFVA